MSIEMTLSGFRKLTVGQLDYLVDLKSGKLYSFWKEREMEKMSSWFGSVQYKIGSGASKTTLLLLGSIATGFKIEKNARILEKEATEADLRRFGLLPKIATPISALVDGPTLNKGNFIIASIQEGRFSAAPKPKVHLNISDAKAECLRLTKLNPGTKFVVLEVKMTAVIGNLDIQE